MPACPVCLSTLPTLAWRYGVYAILECPICALQFADPMTAASSDYYRDRYAEIDQATLPGNLHPGLRYTIAQLQRVIRCYLQPNQRRALDVGCGPGYLLAELTRQGFDGLGIDFNPAAVRVATEHFGVQAQVGRVEDLVDLCAQFDLVLLIHVLEHVQDPLGLLRRIRQVLAPNGILVIDLPNRLRFMWKRTLTKGEFGEGEYPPHHLTFWSIPSLGYALRLAGFDILECSPRPFNSEDQIDLFLMNRFHLPANRFVARGSRILGMIGHALGWQGETIFAVARRVE